MKFTDEYMAYSGDIRKNSQVLGYLQYDTKSLFSKLPRQYLFKIASDMGKDPNVIENDKLGYELVKNNFTEIEAKNDQEASQIANEKFQELVEFEDIMKSIYQY